jgi:ferritin
MIPTKIEDALNAQMNKELESEYIYLSMAAYFNSMDLAGFENFFLVHVKEERSHAMKIYNFLAERGGTAVMKPIAAPAVEYESPQKAFEQALAHEEYISSSINELMSLSIQEQDYATASFLNWFVDEQVEEEDLFGTVLNKIKLVGGAGHGMLRLDEEYAQRTFVPDTQDK